MSFRILSPFQGFCKVVALTGGLRHRLCSVAPTRLALRRVFCSPYGRVRCCIPYRLYTTYLTTL